MTTTRGFLAGAALGALTAGGAATLPALAADPAVEGLRVRLSAEHKWCAGRLTEVTEDEDGRRVGKRSIALPCRAVDALIAQAREVDMSQTDVDARGRLDADEYVDSIGE